MADLEAFVIVFLRPEIGIPVGMSPGSCTAATIAAILLAAFEETLLRRDTRWLEFKDPDETE